MINNEIASFLKESNDIEGYEFPIEDYYNIEKYMYEDVDVCDNIYLDKTLQALAIIFCELIKKSKEIDKNTIEYLHSSLMDGLPNSENIKIGDFRDCNVQVGGRICPEPFLAAELMNNWILDFNSMEHDPLEMHYRFELIHPFQDGNGRIGRLLYLYDLLRRGLPVKNILDNFEGNDFYEKRANYYMAIDNFNNKNRN